MMLKLIVLIFLVMEPLYSFAAPDGKALYRKHCIACHQTQGHGGIGLPLTADTLATMSDQYIRKTIYFGRIGRVMPSFPTLSDAQAKAIIHYLRETTQTQSAVYSIEKNLGDPLLGKALYQEHCIKCHGNDGQGEGSGTGVTLSRERSFLIMPAAIANSGFLASASDGMIKNIIMKGRVKQGMPAFAQKGVSASDIEHIIAYVRSMNNEQLIPEPLEDDERPTKVIESPYSFEETVTNLKRAIKGENFRVFPARYLEQGLFDEFSVNKRQLGVRFCRFSSLYQMLKIEPRLGAVLPCRITVIEKDNKDVILVIPNLRVLARLFNNDELVTLWDEMEQTFNDLIEVVTL